MKVCIALPVLAALSRGHILLREFFGRMAGPAGEPIEELQLAPVQHCAKKRWGRDGRPPGVLLAGSFVLLN